MRRVYKYPIPRQPVFHLDLPEGAEVLAVDCQHDAPQLWALVDPDAPPIERVYRMVGTGHDIADGQNLQHVATFQMASGYLVWHLFEVMR